MRGRLQDSVFLVVGGEPNNQQFGTAFAFYRDEQGTYFLTCKHVVTDVGGADQVVVGDQPADVVASSSQVGFDDLAVLRVKGLSDVPTTTLGVAGETGSSIMAIGFQQFADGYLVRPLRGKLGEQIGLEFRRQPTRTRAWDMKMEGDYSLQRGYSGAPVVDEQSEDVIAVASYRLGNTKGVAISIETLENIWPGMYAVGDKVAPQAHSAEVTLLPGERRRLREDLARLQERRELLSEKVRRLGNALEVEADPLRKFQYEKQLSVEEQRLTQVGQEIADIEKRLA